MADTTTVDYTTDMQTIRDYVAAVTELQTKLAIAYTSALADVETTFQSASPAETRPDILGVMLKSGLKTLEKLSIGAVKDSTGIDVGPAVDMVHAIYDEVDRASKAATNLAAADWIKSLRLDVTNNYTQGQTGDGLRLQLENEYNQGDEGYRGGYIGGVQNSLDAVRQTTVPRTERIEVTMYESWINAAFNNDCVDGTGILSLNVNDDGTAGTATVTAPYGDKVAGALNSIMATAGVTNLMSLDVVKKLSQGDSSMCFEGNNVIRKDTDNDSAHAVLVSPSTWNLFQLFTT
jgi:hypothetical protein